MNYGKIERSDEHVTFRYERQLRHPVDRVWRGITDPAEIEAWSGTRPEIELVEGGAYVTYHGPGPDRMRVADRIVRLRPPTLFEHTFWVHVNPSALVTWELAAVDGGCQLNLTHRMNVDEARAVVSDDIITILSRNGAGWHRLLDKLTALLDGTTPDLGEDLRAHYAAQLS